MQELDCEESWAPKNWCVWTVVLEKTLESPLDCKEIQPVHSKADQLWVFFGRNDAKAETPILWPPHAKSWLIGKDSDAGSNWGQEEKGTTEDEMAGWHHRLDGHEFEWTPGDGDGQGGLVCCDSRGRKESDRTEQLNWTELKARWREWEMREVGSWEDSVLWSERWDPLAGGRRGLERRIKVYDNRRELRSTCKKMNRKAKGSCLAMQRALWKLAILNVSCTSLPWSTAQLLESDMGKAQKEGLVLG